MINYIVIGVCIFLLLLVIFISAKPIGMGIEARREIKDNLKDQNLDQNEIVNEELNKINISEELTKLNNLKEQGIITDEEYQKAKKKILD